ncbi:MAG: hypothetical protein P4L46_10000 [Fimbriimonas sp.]|nr:hypothetical protein [Fimbriimonas sp.]
MGKKKTKPDPEKAVARTVDRLKKIGFTYPYDLEDRPGADDLIAAYMTAAGKFVEPLAEGMSAHGLRQGVHDTLLFLDQLLASMASTIDFADIGKATIACRKGCSHCCHIRVTTKAPVVLALAFYLRKRLSVDELDLLLKRIERHVAEGLKMSPVEQVLQGRMCPLNVDGACIGYEYRPHACRTHHSFDVTRCQAAEAGIERDVRVPQDINRYSVQALVVRPVTECMKRLGLNDDDLEFIPALQIALTQPDAIERYLSGDPIFAPAHRPEVLEAQDQQIIRLGLSRTPKPP